MPNAALVSWIAGPRESDHKVGPQPPEALEQNWVPTAGRDFWLLFRFYGPDAALFDKTWTAKDVEHLR